MTDIDKLIAEWRTASEGVTPGWWSWRAGQPKIFARWNGTDYCIASVEEARLGWHEDRGREGRETGKNAAWIARCSPTGISALLDTVEALKAERDEAIKAADAALDLNEPIIARGDDWKAHAEAAEAKLAEVERERDEAKDEGATFVLDALAKAIGLEQWQIHDGTETWDGDVCASLYGIEWAKSKCNFALGVVRVNGKFHHFADPDTDTAWLGFEAGFRRASPPELTALRERVAELEKVLEPIVAVCASHDAHAVRFLRGEGGKDPYAARLSDDELARLFALDSQVCLTDGALTNPVSVTWGHLRAARRTLKGGKDNG